MEPDGPVEIIGAGTGSGGERWTLTAKRAGPDLDTVLHIFDADGRPMWGGGLGGPPMHRRCRMNRSEGNNDLDGPRYLVARVPGDVAGVVVTLSDDTREDLVLHGDPAKLGGVRVAALVYRRELDIHRIALVDRNGHELPGTWPPPVRDAHGGSDS